MNRICSLMLVGVTTLVATTFSNDVIAEEVTLRAVSYTPINSETSSHFARFIDKVNAEGKGLVQIKFLGGAPKVMTIFEVGNAVSKGSIDIANVSGVFYASLVPVANATFYSEYTIQELRKLGVWETIVDIHREKMNVHYLARARDRMTLNYFVNKKITKPDFSGMKIRSSTLHTPFIKSLGGTPIETGLPQIYPALERGVVDGLGFPTSLLMDFRLHEVVEYRIEPSFYRVDIALLVNLRVWENKLNNEQRAFLTKMGQWVESINMEDVEKNQAAKRRQEDAGMKVIRFTGQDCIDYIRKGYEAGWAAVTKRDPETATKLRKLIYNPAEVEKAFCS